MPLGYEFQPDQEKRLRTNINQLSPFASQALQVLSLRLPNILGGRPISPDALLREAMGGTAPGGGSVIDSNVGSPASGVPSSPTSPLGGSSPLSVINFPTTPTETQDLSALVGEAL